MIIQNPRIPDDDTEPGEIPLVIPDPTDPDPDDDLIPVNVAPNLEGNAPPEWKPVRPQAIKTPDGIYAIFPTGWNFDMLMGGVAVTTPDGETEVHNPPEYYLTVDGLFTVNHGDGSLGTTHMMPYIAFSGAPQIPAGWEFVSTPPEGYTFPIIDPPVKSYDLIRMHHFGQAAGYVNWGIWNRLAKPENIQPEGYWYADVYIRSLTIINYGLFRKVAMSRRGGAGIIPIITTLGLAALFGSVANTQPTANAARRRRYVKDHIGQ